MPIARKSWLETKEVNRFDLEKPCHVSRKVPEQSRDAYIIYLCPGNVM
jgi:hypothetical protein